MMTFSSFVEQWNDDRPYIEARTSGSTGKPKEIRLPKADMLQSARATNAFFGISAASFLFCPLSLGYIAGKMMAVRALAAGCEVEFVTPSNEISLPQRTIDLLPVVPSQLPWLMAHADGLERVRHLLIGGAAPSAEQCRQLAGLGIEAFVSYGMTETCSHVAVARADDPRRVYRAMPGITFSTSADGRLIVEAPAFSFKTLQTNDVVDLLDSHSFCWTGRADNVINSGGIKMFAEELEALYAPVMEGVPFFVSSVPDDKWGQAVVLVVETARDKLAALRRALESAIADHRRLPKHYYAVAALPRTSSGKPIRKVF